MAYTETRCHRAAGPEVVDAALLHDLTGKQQKPVFGPAEASIT